MRTPARLALYGAGLAVAFGGAYGLAGVFVPDSVVESWNEQSRMIEQSLMDEHAEEGGAQ